MLVILNFDFISYECNNSRLSLKIHQPVYIIKVMKFFFSNTDFDDYPDPREYYDYKEDIDVDEETRLKIIDALEEEFHEQD